MKRTTSMSTVILGGGRFATALATALIERGMPPQAVVVRDLRRARRLQKILAEKTALVRWRDMPIAELYILAIRDDALEGVAVELAASSLPQPAIALHVAGAHGPEPLAALASCGVATGVWHPLQTFDGSPESAAGFEGACFRIEGAAAACNAALGLTRLLRGRVLELPSSDVRSRTLYHAAASIVSNDIVAVWETAVRTLAATGLSRKEARRALAPLALTTLQHLAERESSEVLTGPLLRGDVRTIENHLAVLRQEDPGAASLHVELSRRLLDEVLTTDKFSPALRKRFRKVLAPTR